MTSMIEGLQETSESERQSVLSAQELAAVLRMKCRKKLLPVIPGKNEVKGLTKEVAEQRTKKNSRRKLHALLICSSTTTKNRLFATLYADRES